MGMLRSVATQKYKMQLQMCGWREEDVRDKDAGVINCPSCAVGRGWGRGRGGAGGGVGMLVTCRVKGSFARGTTSVGRPHHIAVPAACPCRGTYAHKQGVVHDPVGAQ